MVNVLVVDYGMGNLGSVQRALETCGARVLVSQDPLDLKQADKILLPGVGAFADGIRNLKQKGWVEAIGLSVRKDKKPLLGVCLGMQLLAEKGLEGGEAEGLCLIRGVVTRLKPTSSAMRIPHVGWNEIHVIQEKPLFSEIQNGSDFYFAHSYHFTPEDSNVIAATTPYCGKFASAVQSENIYGVQFHPEKSQRPGLRLLRNFLNS